MFHMCCLSFSFTKEIFDNVNTGTGQPHYNAIFGVHGIINLGAMTWLCYIENPTIVRRVIMRLNCLNSSLTKMLKYYTYLD